MKNFDIFCNEIRFKTSYIQRRIKVMQDIEQIYEKYFETVNKYLLCLTRNNNISEELTQETFYKAMRICSDLHDEQQKPLRISDL